MAMKTETVYKLCALAGLALVALTPYLAWQTLSDYEQRAVEVFKHGILTELDLQSLYRQMQALEQSIRLGRAPDSKEKTGRYSRTQMNTLQREIDILRGEVDNTAQELQQVNTAQQRLVDAVKRTLIIALIALSMGLMLAVLGFMAWYFHIRIFEDRRRTPREPAGD